MKYRFKDDAMMMPFMVPASIVDKHLKLSNANQLKVILFMLRNISSGIDVELCAKELSMPQSEVEDALIYWQQCGIIQGEAQPQKAPELPEKKAVVRAEKPSRSDVARRGLEDDKISFILREAQMKFGRNLKTNEASTLVWLYDDMGMTVSLILYLLEYAASEGRCNISFVEGLAVKWLNSGIEDVKAAELYVKELARKKLSWSIVERVFGIEKRNPSEKELEFSNKWLNEWGLSEELLKLAYDECVDKKSKLSLAYINKILENWNKEGIKSAEDYKKRKQESSKPTDGDEGGSDSVAYELDLFEKMLNKDE